MGVPAFRLRDRNGPADEKLRVCPWAPAPQLFVEITIRSPNEAPADVHLRVAPTISVLTPDGRPHPGVSAEATGPDPHRERVYPLGEWGASRVAVHGLRLVAAAPPELDDEAIVLRVEGFGGVATFPLHLVPAIGEVRTARGVPGSGCVTVTADLHFAPDPASIRIVLEGRSGETADVTGPTATVGGRELAALPVEVPIRDARLSSWWRISDLPFIPVRVTVSTGDPLRSGATRSRELVLQ